MLKKLIASGSAAVIALSQIASGLVVGAPAVTDPELIDAVSWAYDAGLTKYSDADAFMPYNNLTREQFAKFASEFAYSVLDVQADPSASCSFSDESSFDPSLASSITMACQQGLMMGSNGMFMAKQLVTRGQVATVISRALGEIDPQASQQEHFNYLQSQGIMNVANLDSAITRGDTILILYRVANGSNTDLCTIDPSLPGCTGTGTGSTGTGVVVVIKEGDLQVSLNPSSPANMSSIPATGTSKFATVDFTAGSKDVSLNTIELMRGGLGSYTDFGNGGRVYFEVGGVRVSSRGSVSSDDKVALSFAPALVVPAGKTVSVDLMAELLGSPVGTENMFTSSMIDSSAATVNGSITTPTLRTAAYSVRSITFTNQNIATTYQGNEDTVELGKFQLQNIGSNTINANIKAITFRNVGNGDAASSLSDLKLLRAGSAVSTSVILNGRDITFVLADTITDGQTASYTIQGKVINVDNSSGDTYKFILRQSTDLNASEASTSFRTAVSITTNVANDTLLVNGVYTVQGGELRFTRDTSLSLSQNVSPGSLQVELLKGTIDAKQAILLEDPILSVVAGTGTISNAFKKVYMQIGSSVFTWTPDPTTPANNALAEFDGSVTVNGSVPVRIYADVYTNATAPAGPYTFGSLDANSFTRKEYVSTQNTVSSSIGNIAGSAVALISSTLSISKFDSLGTVVYSTNNAQNKVFYGVRLSNNQSNDIKVGSLTLTPSNIAFNNGVSVTLMQGSTALATRTLNGATTFNGLNILVKKDTPIDLTFEGNFLSTIVAPQVGTFSVSFNAGDVIDNVTSNNVSVVGTTTSAQLSIISAGSTVINTSSSVPAQSFVTANDTVKIGTVNIQAVNDELEVRGLYLKVNGTGAFAANAGNQVSNLQIKDSAGNLVASESSRATETNANDIAKFTSFVTATKIPAGSSKSFDVYGTINPVNNSASAGEFNISLATTYNDTSYTDEYQGTRLFSVNAGTYVAAGTVGGVLNPTAFQATTVTLSSNYYVVASYPKLQAVDLVGDDFKLIEFKITNPSTTNTLRANSFAYVANATTTGDLYGKVADVYVNSNPQASTLTVSSTGSYTFAAPLDVAPGQSVTIKVQLQTSYVASPASGTRTRNFTIDNLGFTQVFSDASTQTITSINLGYQPSAGLKLQASKTY